MSGDVDHPAPAGSEGGPALFDAVSVRKGRIWIAAVLAATGAVFLWAASPLDFGTLSLPGSGFMPTVLSVATIALAAIIGVREWVLPGDGETVALGHRDVLIVFAAMLAVPPLFETLGAYLTLGVFGAVLLVLIARCSIVVAVAASAVAMVGCWYFFQVALGLQLPIGAVLEGMGL